MKMGVGQNQQIPNEPLFIAEFLLTQTLGKVDEALFTLHGAPGTLGKSATFSS